MNDAIIPQFTTSKLINSRFKVRYFEIKRFLPCEAFSSNLLLILQLQCIALSASDQGSLGPTNEQYICFASDRHKTEEIIQKFDKQCSYKYSIKIDELANALVFIIVISYIVKWFFIKFDMHNRFECYNTKDREIDTITKSTWVTVCSTFA